MGRTGVITGFYLDKDVKAHLLADAEEKNISLSGLLNNMLCEYYNIDNSGYFANTFKEPKKP